MEMGRVGVHVETVNIIPERVGIQLLRRKEPEVRTQEVLGRFLRVRRGPGVGEGSRRDKLSGCDGPGGLWAQGRTVGLFGRHKKFKQISD